MNSAKLYMPRPGYAVLEPAFDGPVLTEREFEEKAFSFLKKTLDVNIFIEICSIALKSATGITAYESLVQKYLYLAHMTTENYSKAMLAAQTMPRYGEDLMHRQMLFTIALRRNNHQRALDHLDKIIHIATENYMDASGYITQRRELGEFISRIKHFTAENFCRGFLHVPRLDTAGLNGIPVIIDGTAGFIMHREPKKPYLLFNVAAPPGSCKIYCHLPPSEVPFSGALKSPGPVRVFGYFSSAEDGHIVMQPCNLLD